MATFEARYQVDDGYYGQRRPNYFHINANELEDDMDEEQLIEFYEEAVVSHFQEWIHPSIERADKFVAWAQEQLASRVTEDG